MELTKHSLKSALAIRSDAGLARYFGISRSAVTQWGDDKPIPEVRQLWLQVHRPEVVRQLKEK